MKEKYAIGDRVRILTGRYGEEVRGQLGTVVDCYINEGPNPEYDTDRIIIRLDKGIKVGMTRHITMNKDITGRFSDCAKVKEVIRVGTRVQIKMPGEFYGYCGKVVQNNRKMTMADVEHDAVGVELDEAKYSFENHCIVRTVVVPKKFVTRANKRRK